MNSTLVILVFLFLVNINGIYGEEMSCNFLDGHDYGYTCYLTIQNPNGLNNFTGINGTHLVGMSDSDVQHIEGIDGSNTTNIPSIICETFKYTTHIRLISIGIQNVNEYSFENCKNLSHLDLGYNSIADLPKNLFNSMTNLRLLFLYANEIQNLRIEWFENLENLFALNLGVNQIEELPKNVFSSLKSLEYIGIDSNKLKVIHSDSFGILSNLTNVYLYNNQINAIDEKFIDNTRVQRLDMGNNICASVNILDNSDSRQSMRNALQTCFDNYKTLYPETTTVTPTTISSPSTEEQTSTISQTLPPGCNDGNLDERVCRLEDKNEDLEQRIEAILREKDEMQRNFNDALEDIQNQILILSTRPCSCQ